jgi:hypothetical protein
MYGRPCARENKRGVAIRVTHRGTCVTAEAVPSARGPTATRTSLRAEIRAAPSRSDRRSKSHFGRRCLVPGDTRLWALRFLGLQVGWGRGWGPPRQYDALRPTAHARFSSTRQCTVCYGSRQLQDSRRLEQAIELFLREETSEGDYARRSLSTHSQHRKGMKYISLYCENTS